MASIFEKRYNIMHRCFAQALKPDLGGLSVLIEFFGRIGFIEQLQNRQFYHPESPNHYDPGQILGIDFGARVGIRSPEGRKWFPTYFESAVTVPGPEVDELASVARALRAPGRVPA